MSISHLRKLAKKSLIPRSLVCLTTASPFSTFPNLPTSAYYDDLSNTARHKRDFSKLRYLLNKRVREHCFNTSSTFKFITNSETSLSILADLIQTLARLDNGFPRKSAFYALIAVPASSTGWTSPCKLYALLKQGYHDQAVKFIMICGGKEEGLDSENFRILGSKLIEFERFKEAKLVLEEM